MRKPSASTKPSAKPCFIVSPPPGSTVGREPPSSRALAAPGRRRGCPAAAPMRSAAPSSRRRAGSVRSGSGRSARAPARAADGQSTSSHSTMASSIAMPAPNARCGVVVCAASPISTTLPRFHGGGTSIHSVGLYVTSGAPRIAAATRAIKSWSASSSSLISRARSGTGGATARGRSAPRTRRGLVRTQARARPSPSDRRTCGRRRAPAAGARGCATRLDP